MKIHCKYFGIKGFVKLYEYGLKWRHMITEKVNQLFNPIIKASVNKISKNFKKFLHLSTVYIF